MYTLMARDGTVINLPRYKLMLCNKDGSKPDNIKWADTIPNRWNGEIREIKGYNPRTKKFKVAFIVPDKEDYIDEIPESYMKGNYPQMVNKYMNEH